MISKKITIILFVFQQIKQREWVLTNFPKDTRYETIILSSKDGQTNLLTAETIRYVSYNVGTSSQNFRQGYRIQKIS